jgi:hypothetical protein
METGGKGGTAKSAATGSGTIEEKKTRGPFFPFLFEKEKRIYIN